jgi:hypothetical protein
MQKDYLAPTQGAEDSSKILFHFDLKWFKIPQCGIWHLIAFYENLNNKIWYFWSRF